MVQIIWPSSKRPPPTADRSIACHSAVMSPKPAISSTPIDHEAYMAVTRSRGWPSCPTVTATRIAPTPPTAKMPPSASARRSSRFLTRNGSSTCSGPTKTSRLSMADTRVAQIQGVARTNTSPSRTS